MQQSGGLLLAAGLDGGNKSGWQLAHPQDGQKVCAHT